MARPRRARHAEARHRSAPDAVRRRRCARRGAARGPAAARDVPDERRRGRARRVLRRGARRSVSRAASCCSPSAPRSCTSPTIPSKAWAEIGKYVLYEAQTYASFQTPGQHSTPGVHAASVDDLKASPQYVVGTPDEVFARLQDVPGQGGIVFHPLAGGLPSALALVEPGAVRGEGPAPAAPCAHRVTRPLGKRGFGRTVAGQLLRGGSAWPATATSTARSAPARDTQELTPALDDVRLRRAGPEGGAQRARARARRAVREPGRLGHARARRARRRARGVDPPHRRDRGAGRVPRRARHRVAAALDADVAPAPRAQRHPRHDRARPRSGSRRRPPTTTPTSRGPRSCASSSPRCSRRWPATANAAPTSSTRPTRSTSAAAELPTFGSRRRRVARFSGDSNPSGIFRPGNRLIGRRSTARE